MNNRKELHRAYEKALGDLKAIPGDQRALWRNTESLREIHAIYLKDLMVVAVRTDPHDATAEDRNGVCNLQGDFYGGGPLVQEIGELAIKSAIALHCMTGSTEYVEADKLVRPAWEAYRAAKRALDAFDAQVIRLEAEARMAKQRAREELIAKAEAESEQHPLVKRARKAVEAFAGIIPLSAKSDSPGTPERQ